jgi:hypothetical protein
MGTDIVTELRAIQIALGENDAVFSARLGVHRTTWVLVRTGKRQPGAAFLGGVKQAFPKLAASIGDFLVSANVANASKS